MPRHVPFSSLAVGLFAALLTSGLIAPKVLAQDPTEPMTLRVTRVVVNPGYNGAWRANQTDIVVPYAEKAGYPFLSTYRVRFGEADFAVVSPVSTYDITGARLDDASLQKYRKAIRESVSSTDSYVQMKHPDLSYGPASEEPWPHISVSHVTLAPGMRSKFIENFKTIAIPRWKKMGLSAMTVWEIIYGADSGQFVIVVPIENYAELSEGTPFYRGMTEAERAELLTGMEGVIVNIERVVGDYLPEESYASAQ